MKNWDWMKPEERYQVTVERGGYLTNTKPERITYIIEEVAYWRKANAIHRWFVENVQDGDDDCGQYSVSEKQLRTLLSACSKVLKSCELIDGVVINGYRFENGQEIPITEDGKLVKDPTTASDLLPTQAGFFFGSTNYDQWYLADIRYTKAVLETLLAEEPDGRYSYSSSW